MKKYDLHTHTRESDGTLSIRELLEKAKNIGLSGVAITDHDTMEGIPKAIEIAKKIGIEFIPGIEFSCSFNGDEIHILGFYLEENIELQKKLDELKIAREKRNEKIVKKLQNLGLKIDLEEVIAEATGTIVSRAHICNVMLKKGYAYTKGEVFKQYLGSKGVAYAEKENSNPFEIVKLIKKSKGVAILAHPGLINESKEKVEKLIDLLKESGLDGIEAIYSSYSEKEVAYYKDLAERKNLIISGGSDYHGENRVEVELGQVYLNEKEMERVRKCKEETK